MWYTERGVNVADKEYDYVVDTDEFDNFTISIDPQYSSNFTIDTITAPTIDLDELDQFKYNYNTKDSVEERLSTIEDRLAILRPDPEKLEKWEALREAYEHYKSLEALIGNTEPEDEC